MRRRPAARSRLLVRLLLAVMVVPLVGLFPTRLVIARQGSTTTPAMLAQTSGAVARTPKPVAEAAPELILEWKGKQGQVGVPAELTIEAVDRDKRMKLGEAGDVELLVRDPGAQVADRGGGQGPLTASPADGGLRVIAPLTGGTTALTIIFSLNLTRFGRHLAAMRPTPRRGVPRRPPG